MTSGTVQDGREDPAGPAGYVVVLRHLREGDAGFRLGFSVDTEDTAKIYICYILRNMNFIALIL